MINVQYLNIDILRKNNTEKYNQTIVYIGVLAHCLKIIAAWNYMSTLQLLSYYYDLSTFICLQLSTYDRAQQSTCFKIVVTIKLYQTPRRKVITFPVDKNRN